MEATRHTCLKLEVPTNVQPNERSSIFVKGTWNHHRFDLSITDGLNAWTCHGAISETTTQLTSLGFSSIPLFPRVYSRISMFPLNLSGTATEDEVRLRAAQWDQEPSDYVALAERYLGFQQPGSAYGFSDAGNGDKRLSWTFDKEGMKLEWRWKCQPASDNKTTTAGILDFLMDANIRLSEEVVRKTQSFERLKVESEKCLAQSEKICDEKVEFETAIYAKFLNVLNAKKAKLREYRDQLSKQTTTGSKLKQEEYSSDKTESFDDESDTEKN